MGHKEAALMQTDAKLTSELFWLSALVTALIDVGLVLLSHHSHGAAILRQAELPVPVLILGASPQTDL